MNERIRELMDKAMVKTGDMSRRDDTELDPEKFAELIVRECCEEISKQNDGERLDDWERGYDQGLHTAIDVIKKHFGVEE